MQVVIYFHLYKFRADIEWLLQFMIESKEKAQKIE